MASSRSAELIIKVVAQVQDAVSGINKVASTASGFGRTMQSGVSKGINAVATATATVIGLTAAATAGVIAQGVSYNVLQQRARAAFTTVLGSAKAADKMLSDLQKFASTSPFPRQAFIEATQQMLAFGFASKDVIPTLDAVQNAVAAAGGSSQDILEIVDVLSKVKSTGKITAETLNQLGYRGVDAAKIIGEQMGKTGAQIREEISKGALGADDAIGALTKGMAKKFAGAADGLKGTWVGAVDRVKGATRDLGSALVEPFISVKGGGYAVVWANQVADILRQLEAEVGPILTGMLDKLAPVFDAITTALGKVDLAGMFDKASSALSGLAPLLAPLIAALGAMGGANIGAMLGPLGSLVPTINPVVAALVALVATLPELRNAIGQILPILVDLGKTIGKAIGPAIQDAMPAIHEMADALGKVLVSAVEALAPVIGNVVSALAPLLPIVADVAAQVLNFLAPALVTVIGVIGKFLGWLTQAPGPLKALAVGIGIAAAAVWAINAAMAANPVSLIIIGIAALIVLVVACYQRFETFRNIVNAVWGAIKNGASAVVNWLKANWLTVLVGVLTGPFGLLVLYVVKNFNKIKAAAKALWNAIKAGARAVGNAVKTVFSAAFGAVAGIVRRYVGVIRTVLNGIKTVVSAVAGYVRERFASAWRAVADIARSQISAIRTALSNIRSAISSIVSYIRSAFTSAWSAVSSAATRALSPIRSAIDGIHSAISSLIGAVSSLISALGRIKVPKISLPKIPGLKSAAPPVTSSSALTAGKRSTAPSLATPRSRGAASSSGGVNITIQGAVDPEAVARQIKRIIGGHDRRIGAGLRTT